MHFTNTLKIIPHTGFIVQVWTGFPFWQIQLFGYFLEFSFVGFMLYLEFYAVYASEAFWADTGFTEDAVEFVGAVVDSFVICSFLFIVGIGFLWKM